MEPERQLTLVLADDHAIVREGIAALCASHGFRILGQCSDGPAAIEMILTQKPDLALLDVHMPGVTGIEAVRRLLPPSAAEAGTGAADDTRAAVAAFPDAAVSGTGADAAGAAGARSAALPARNAPAIISSCAIAMPIQTAVGLPRSSSIPRIGGAIDMPRSSPE